MNNVNEHKLVKNKKAIIFNYNADITNEDHEHIMKIAIS